MPYCDRFSKQNTWSSSLAKYAFSGTQQMEFPQAQFCKKCVRECVYMCVCVLSYYLYCANFFNLGDSGCEFDARQLWLKTLAWSTEDH